MNSQATAGLLASYACASCKLRHHKIRRSQVKYIVANTSNTREYETQAVMETRIYIFLSLFLLEFKVCWNIARVSDEPTSKQTCILICNSFFVCVHMHVLLLTYCVPCLIHNTSMNYKNLYFDACIAVYCNLLICLFGSMRL